MAEPPEAAGELGRMPYLTPGGALGIPFSSPERYHWWKPDGERMHVAEIVAEVRLRMAETGGKENHAVGV